MNTQTEYLRNAFVAVTVTFLAGAMLMAGAVGPAIA